MARRGRPPDGSLQQRLNNLAETLAYCAVMTDVLTRTTAGRAHEIAQSMARELGYAAETLCRWAQDGQPTGRLQLELPG